VTGLLLLTLIFSPFLLGPFFALFPKRNLQVIGLVSTAFSLCLFILSIYFSLNLLENGPFQLFTPWVPELYLSFSFLADGLALFYVLLITGMGTLVCLYAHYYMDCSELRIRHFYCFIHLFMGAMLGAVLADNFILLFLFWEITGVMSYLLIAYHYEAPKAISASKLAFLLSSLASLCLLIGFILIGVLDHTLEISEVEAKGLIEGEHNYWFFAVMLLLLIGIYAKSAQFPLHFWLPEAMAAPTPVSAYLHSATMVKLGIYLVARISIIFATSELWLPLVTTLSLVTMLVGGIAALFAKPLKRILAYATISQLGFFISFYGLSDPQGLEYDYVHIFNHALYKGSLFMLAGIFAHSASITTIDQLGGIARKMPLCTAIFTLALAVMAGIPGTTGFLSKELLIKDIVLLAQQGTAATLIFIALLLGLLFKVAFTYRLFYYLFFSMNKNDAVVAHKPKLMMFAAPFILSSAALILGIWPRGILFLLKIYQTEGLHHEVNAEELLGHGNELNLILSLCIFGGGIFLFYLSKRYHKHLPSQTLFNLANTSNNIIEKLPSYAQTITKNIHSSKPQVNLAWVFLFFSLTIAYALSSITANIELSFIPTLDSLIKVLIILALASVLLLRKLMAKLIGLSLVGFFITLYFTIKSAPDVAMTQMLVEVATLFVFILFFSKLTQERASPHSIRRAVLALVFGISVSFLPLMNGSLLSEISLGTFYLENAPILAKGNNTVNTILVDFRALDTLGEIAVIAVAALAVYGLFARHDEKCSTLIPSPLFKAVMPLIFFCTLIYSLYLTLKGHNEPGGGFIGAMVAANCFILFVMAMGQRAQAILHKTPPMAAIFAGLALSLLASSISLLSNDAWMSAYFIKDLPFFNTPLLFDLGVFLLVFGAALAIIIRIRENSLFMEEK